MKKFLFLLCSLLATVGAWAGTVEVNTVPDVSAFNDNAGIYYFGVQMPGTSSDTYALSGFSVYENTGYLASAKYVALATAAPSAASSWTVDESAVLGISNENPTPAAAGFVDYTLATSIQVKGGTTYYVLFFEDNAASAGTFTAGAQRVRLVNSTSYEPTVCLSNGTLRTDLTPGFKATLTTGGNEEAIYIETDMTSTFKSLTNANNWKTGNGGAAGTAPDWACPPVTPNGFTSAVSVCEFYEGGCTRTGEILTSQVKGLAPGTYKIELYGGAAFTFDRGFGSMAFTGDLNTATSSNYNANDKIEENTGVTLYAESEGKTYGGEIPIYYATSFPNGPATVELDVEVGASGTIKIGMSKTSQSTNWHIIQLKGVTAKVLATDALATAVAKAEALEGSIPTSAFNELKAVVDANNKTYDTADEYIAAIAAIDEAVAKTDKYAAPSEYFAKMKAVLDKTNVYTEEGYNSVYGTWLAEYEAGTLDDAVMATLNANLAYSTGWHSSNNIDDVLLSAWTIGGEQCANYDKGLYINTWSTEGNNDGSQFYTPFFEYWTGDDNSLGGNALTATVTGLEAGATYEVSAWVRERAKNGVDAADVTGITLTVGDGEAVDVTEGEKVGTTQFNIGTYKATGKADADGKLTITFNVAADNNISWLSYKDVKYAKAEGGEEPIPSDPYEAAMAQIKDGGYYTISTKVGGKTYYMTGEGTLSADEFAATAFNFVAESPSKDAFKPTAWNLGYNFTNPHTEGDVATGAVVNDGKIRIYEKEHRMDYECQVFFYNGEAYAIRATNKYKGESQASEWGANTFWNVFEGELPSAGYALDESYIWNLTEVANPEAQALKNAIAEAKVLATDNEGVGGFLFQKSVTGMANLDKVAEAQKAVANKANATAEEIAAAQAALNKAIQGIYNLPEEGTKFTLKNKAADLYACFTETEKNQNLAGLSAEPVEFTWTAAEDGSYYLTNGTNYYGFSADWNISTDEASKGTVTFEAVELEDGLYYIMHTPASSYRGTNSLIGASASKLEAGMRIFSDKKANGTDPVYWIISPNEEVKADPYEAALAAINDGANYSIFTEVNGEKYYLTTNGTLVAEHKDAGTFTFKKVSATNHSEFGEFGFNLDPAYFSNPPLNNSQAVLQTGAIARNTASKRTDWEAQVFLLQNGKYAVRATNAPGAESGWGDAGRTFWTVGQGEEGPVAEYSYEQNFIWQLEENKLVEIACNLVQDGQVIASETATMAVGFVPAAPAAWNEQYHNLYAFTSDVEVIAEGTTAVNFTPEWDGPFKFSKSFDKANWYNMNIRNGWFVHKCETEPYTMNNAPTEEDKASAEYQWAFLPVEGEPFQIIVLNRASEGQSLSDDAGNQVVMRDGEYKWEIFANGDGFVLRPAEGEGVENWWINQNGGAGATNPLAYWKSTNGKTDGGSTFRVEFVEGPADGIEYAGVIEQTQSHPQAGVMGTTTTPQTILISEVDAAHVNITFSGFALPMAAMGSFNEFTIENVNVAKAEDGSISYALDGFAVGTQMGQMTVNYRGTLEGVQANADATPVLHLTLQNATTDDCYFGASQDAIAAFKAATLPTEEEIAQLTQAIEDALKALEDTPTGELFEKTEAAAEAFEAAVQAAQKALDSGDKEQIVAAFDAIKAAKAAFDAAPVQKPKTKETFAIQNRNGGMYLNLDAENNLVVLGTEPQAFTWEDAGNGAWYITDGTSYVGFAGTNAWSMAAAADKKMAITPEAVELEDGTFYLLKEDKGMIGTDATEAGSKCYADKNADKNGYWIITKVIAPEPILPESPYGFYGDELAEVDEEFGSDYYIYNIATQQFLTGGNSWGTQASRNEVGTRFTVEALEDGTYTLDSHVSNGGTSHYLGSNGYVDAQPFGFTLTKVADDNEDVNVYTISDGTNLLAANADNTIVTLDGADAADQKAQWLLVSTSERLKKLAKATPQNPVDATFMIACSEFSRNDQYKNSWNGAPSIGGNNDNMCAEKWNTNFDINQVVQYIPAGQYEVSVQGFYRAGSPADNTDEQNAFLYANGVETPLMKITAGGQAEKGGAYNTESRGVFVPNNMNEASTAFTAGAYSDNKLITTVFDLTMTLGVKKEVLIGADWTIFDAFRIKYLGYDATTTLAAAAEALAKKVAEAEAVEETLDAEGAALIDAAVKANNKAYNTSWEYAIAVNAIQEAIDKAKAAAGKEDMPIATGIDGIFADGNNDIFDLSGRKVSKVQKGIYIVNGKKVAIK